MTTPQTDVITYYSEKLSEVLQKPNLRSADRANMSTMLTQLKKKKQALDYQQLQNLWAYLNRYGVPVVMRGHR